MQYLEENTIFHLTHYKAGSRWIHRILKRCVADRLLPIQADRAELLSQPIEPGRVYSACYASRSEFEALDIPPDSKRFFIIRDMRDTTVSAYFSLKISHVRKDDAEINPLRDRLADTELEQGLLMILDDWMPLSAEIQSSWLEVGEPFIRYEDLLSDDTGILERALIDQCELGIPRETLREAIDFVSFERLSGGRKRGDENLADHYRKGIAGDWENHFTEPVKDAFKERFGELLIATGYESDNDW